MLTTSEIFKRYEEIRPRLPQVTTVSQYKDISSLMDIAEKGSAFVFDAFGVLNVGETLITGADERLNELRTKGCDIRILTNAASYNHDGAVEKFRRLGISMDEDEIITSRDATLKTLLTLDLAVSGAIAAHEDDLKDIPSEVIRLASIKADYDRVDGFLFLSTSSWTQAQQDILTESLVQNERPVLIANADLVAPRDDGFSLEPGHYGHQLLDHGINQVQFFGKPFPEVYDMVEQSLPNTPHNQIIMCGDSLHTDIIGAAARGWKTVLVTRDGLFAGHPTEQFCQSSQLFPNWSLARI